MSPSVVKSQDGMSYLLIKQDGSPCVKANEFLRSFEIRGLSLCTMRAYAYDLLFLFRWLELTNDTMKNMTQKSLVKFVEYQRMLKAKPRTINRRIITCEAYYQFCYDQRLPHAPGVVYPSPHYKGIGRDKKLGLFQCKKLDRLKYRVKVPFTLVDPLEIQEVEQFFKGIKRYRDRAIVLLMLQCGLRSCEVIALQVDDINFFESRLRVKGKGRKERALPFSQQVAESLHKYLRLERPSQCATKAFFVVLQGKQRFQPMTYSGLRSLFRYKRKLTGVEKANPHRFRHSFGRDLAVAGVQLPVLQKLLGHADGKTTLGYINLSLKDVSKEYHEVIDRISKIYEVPK